MSFNLNNSTFKNTIVSADELITPIGSNLANTSLYNKAPLPGALGYDLTNQAFYYGDGVRWKNDGATGGVGFTGNTGSTGQGFTGNSGPTGLGSTGSMGDFTIGGTGSTGILGSGPTGADGGIGNTGSTGSVSQSTSDYAFVSKSITSSMLSLDLNQPIPFDTFKLGGTITWNGGPTFSVRVGTTGFYLINYGYGNIQGATDGQIPQSFSLANNGVSYGSTFTLQELWDTNTVLASNLALSVKGQSGSAIKMLNAGDNISVINTITASANLPRIFENRVFNIGSSTSGSLAGWMTMVRIG